MISRPILLVDAHDESRDVYRTVLEWAGYEVIEATSGPDGIRAAALEDVSLIVTELLLPGLDGLRLIQALKSDPETAAIPVLVLSAVSSERDVAAAMALGCCGYLVKPCPLPALLSEVERHAGVESS